MRVLSPTLEEKGLRQYLYREVEGLYAALGDKQIIKAAFALRRWVSSYATYPQRELLLLHWEHTLPEFLYKLQENEGGVWCGGAAWIFAELLKLVHIPAAVYMYGSGDLSHETTIFGTKDGRYFRFYVLDAYLNFHYTHRSGRIMELPELFLLIRQGRYDQIVRIDLPIERKLVTLDRDAQFYGWLFPGGAPEKPSLETGGHKVYEGAIHSVDNLLIPGSPFRDLADQARGEKGIDEFMMDLMLVNPLFSRIYEENYVEMALYQGVVGALSRREP